ncbi:MAG: GNAT superfamily N-acetyltransferase [Planctomycetota bacterium]|jgi:GNAT superfamily N-acetyltransferase
MLTGCRALFDTRESTRDVLLRRLAGLGIQLVMKVLKIEDKWLEQANAIYFQLGFVPSCPPADTTCGVIEDVSIVALGRLQQHADGALEVGGFWVHESRRGFGLARRVVEHAIALAPMDSGLWCIPFVHLEGFYASFGMKTVAPELAPASIRDKTAFCRERQRYGIYHATCLMQLVR